MQKIKCVWNSVYEDYDEEYLERFYRYEDAGGRYRVGDLTGAGITRRGDSGKPWRNIDPTSKGRHWAVPMKVLSEAVPDTDLDNMSTQEKLDLLDSMKLIHWPARGGVPQLKRYYRPDKGVLIRDVVSDINPISSHAAERLGYPTQKPVALLERIISASSNEGDVVLDPFCGCGTTITAAQKLKRRWMGIDVTHLAINLIKWRMRDMYNLEPGFDYKIIGEPEDLTGAQALAEQDKYQFQWWALSLINARPYGDKKKGKDTGIDGFVFFNEFKNKTCKGIVSVKSGKTSVKDIRDLKAVVEREKAEVGIFLTLNEPTKDMNKEAVAAGFYRPDVLNPCDYPKIQILTIAELLAGQRPLLHSIVNPYKRAQAETLPLKYEAE